MRSDYYKDKVIHRAIDRDDAIVNRHIKADDAADKKFEDRGETGSEMRREARRKNLDEAVKSGMAADRDFHKDMGLVREYGKDAPKGRGFNTSREGGGIVRDMRDGMAMGGRTRVPRADDSKVLMEAGGYSGGLAESGRGTMAGEMGRKGSMSVREAGEDMFELSKRKRGMQGGGAASSYNRRYNNQNK